MALKHLLKHVPIPHDPALAEEALNRLRLKPGKSRDLVLGIAGSSPFLRGLLEREAEWFHGALEANPDLVFAQILATVDAQVPEALGVQLRRAKRRVALLLAACDLAGVWALEAVTRRLTEFADFATQQALESLVRREQARGKLPGVGPENIEECAGIVVLAMGKMGAFELNYSSDIDLIVLFDEARHAPENFDDVRATFLRITRNMSKILADITADGYVFRTDLRLRPNPSVTLVCVPMEAAERYYESQGRTWERAAFIKARACAGDIVAGQKFLDRIGPFIWRKHLDFVAIQDAHDMRLRIRSHKGLGGPIKVMGHDLKLGRGGIREIEFFAQTQQLIAGGRDRDLRARRTDDALTALAAKGWIPQEMSDQLIAAYRAHRNIEHRIQMIRDAQTHVMPSTPGGMDRLARLSGWKDTDAFTEDIRQRLVAVHLTTEEFFAPVVGERKTQEILDLPVEMVETMDSWAGLPALRSPRSVAIFERLRPELTNRLAKANRPVETLRELDGFIRGLPAGVQLFSLFEANPQILDLLIDICATAPSLAQYLSRNTGVFDAVLSGQFFEPLPDAADLTRDLQAKIKEHPDYEDALNAARRWFKEHHFRIGVLMLRQLASVEEAEKAYSDVAQAVVQCLMPVVRDNFAIRYGGFPGQQIAVIAMGKLGSAQMTATSDLDLIVIYCADGEISDGKKQLAQSSYFSRLTQALITALSTPMAEGRLYEVDMRLRPSGRAGTVATSLVGFSEYQRTKAWTWEHLALARARVVVGDCDLAEQISQVRAEVLNMPRVRADVVADVRDMRRRLAEAKGVKAGAWDVKDRSGGLLAIELLAQTLCLLGRSLSDRPKEQLIDAVSDGLISAQDADTLVDTHRLLSAFQQAHRLLVDQEFDPDKLGRDGTDFVLQVTGYDSVAALKDALAAQTDAAEQIILRNLH